MCKRVDVNRQTGFTLIELIAVIIIVSVIAISMTSRFGSFSSASVLASRDDIIAALFFAQQTSMARSTIRVVITSDSVSVTENNVPIVITPNAYPLTLPRGVTATPITFVYDKLGYTTAGTISLTGSSGDSATVTVEASGYAH